MLSALAFTYVTGTEQGEFTEMDGLEYQLADYGIAEPERTPREQPVTEECLAGRCGNCWDDECECRLCYHLGASWTGAR
jgi:hypothetical protein